MSCPILSVLVWLPIVAACAVLYLGSIGREALSKQIALAISLVTFLMSIPLYAAFDSATLPDVELPRPVFIVNELLVMQTDLLHVRANLRWDVFVVL